jgi:hypothetical protein
MEVLGLDFNLLGLLGNLLLRAVSISGSVAIPQLFENPAPRA